MTKFQTLENDHNQKTRIRKAARERKNNTWRRDFAGYIRKLFLLSTQFHLPQFQKRVQKKSNRLTSWLPHLLWNTWNKFLYPCPTLECVPPLWPSTLLKEHKNQVHLMLRRQLWPFFNHVVLKHKVLLQSSKHASDKMTRKLCVGHSEINLGLFKPCLFPCLYFRVHRRTGQSKM